MGIKDLTRAPKLANGNLKFTGTKKKCNLIAVTFLCMQQRLVMLTTRQHSDLLFVVSLVKLLFTFVVQRLTAASKVEQHPSMNSSLR